MWYFYEATRVSANYYNTIVQLTRDLSSHKYSYCEYALILPTVFLVFYLKYFLI